MHTTLPTESILPKHVLLKQKRIYVGQIASQCRRTLLLAEFVNVVQEGSLLLVLKRKPTCVVQIASQHRRTGPVPRPWAMPLSQLAARYTSISPSIVCYDRSSSFVLYHPAPLKWYCPVFLVLFRNLPLALHYAHLVMSMLLEAHSTET